MGVETLIECPSASDIAARFQLVFDCLFGFSFKAGSIRAPFDTVLNNIAASKVPVASADVPSGWDVDKESGGSADEILQPELLVSLVVPKLCARRFNGTHHFLGGR